MGSDYLARKLMKNGKQKLKLNFPDEHTEVYPEKDKTSKFIGVTYSKEKSKWRAQRWSKIENKPIYNGSYDGEETAAHATDTLARRLMENGKQKLELNFPDECTEVYPEKDERFSSKYIGVSYNKRDSKWSVRRYSKSEKKTAYNGYYDDEETAAHASDTLARKLMENGEKNHKLNFVDDDTQVYKEKNKEKSKWFAQRWNTGKDKNTIDYSEDYDDEDTAAHASDTLARKLMENGEQGHKLNFPDKFADVYPENQNIKRKRPKD